MSVLPNCFESVIRLDIEHEDDSHMYLIKCLDCGDDVCIGYGSNNNSYISKHCRCASSLKYEKEILETIREAEKFHYMEVMKGDE